MENVEPRTLKEFNDELARQFRETAGVDDGISSSILTALVDQNGSIPNDVVETPTERLFDHQMSIQKETANLRLADALCGGFAETLVNKNVDRFVSVNDQLLKLRLKRSKFRAIWKHGEP